MPDWPHAPIHRLDENGAYIVTASTYQKAHVFRGSSRLSLLCDRLLDRCVESRWALQAWAVFPNHYHFVAIAEGEPKSLGQMLQRLHSETAKEVNRLDEAKGRRVWFQYWDTKLTYQRSYLARLRYVHENPVIHGVVQRAFEYRWGSARWFSQKAKPAFQKTVASFKTDRLNVYDEFDVS